MDGDPGTSPQQFDDPDDPVPLTVRPDAAAEPCRPAALMRLMR